MTSYLFVDWHRNVLHKLGLRPDRGEEQLITRLVLIVMFAEASQGSRDRWTRSSDSGQRWGLGNAAVPRDSARRQIVGAASGGSRQVIAPATRQRSGVVDGSWPLVGGALGQILLAGAVFRYVASTAIALVCAPGLALDPGRLALPSDGACTTSCFGGLAGVPGRCGTPRCCAVWSAVCLQLRLLHTGRRQSCPLHSEPGAGAAGSTSVRESWGSAVGRGLALAVTSVVVCAAG